MLVIKIAISRVGVDGAAAAAAGQRWTRAEETRAGEKRNRRARVGWIRARAAGGSRKTNRYIMGREGE